MTRTGSIVSREAQNQTPNQARNSERRMVGKAIAFWEALRGTEAVPARTAFDLAEPPVFVANIFLVTVGASEADCTLVSAGSGAIEALGIDPVGMSASEVLPSATELRLSLCQTVARFAKPVADSGRFVNRSGKDILYRAVIMPLAGRDGTVSHLLGAINHKTMN